jgi:hypothetical protein
MDGAQDSQQSAAQKVLEDWKQAKAAADAEREATEAKIALIASQKSLTVAQHPDPDKLAQDNKLASSNAAKALSDAEKSAADAEKAKADAQAAALKARFGDIPASGYAGSLELKDKAGSTEAALLAAVAIDSAAGILASRPRVRQTLRNSDVWIFALGDLPNFQPLLLFHSYSKIIRMAFESANDRATERLASVKEEDRVPAVEFAPSLAGVGLGLDAVNKLLGFFRTDYSVGGIDLTYDDTMLVHSVAGRLECKSAQIPAIFNTAALTDGGASILDEFTKWGTLRAEAVRRITINQEQARGLSAEAADPQKAANRQEFDARATAHTDAAETLKQAIAVYDNLSAKLTTADDKGAVPLTNAIREQAIFNLLSRPSGAILLVKVQRSGGAYYTKRNLWSLFGGMPLFHMGGAVVSFVLLASGGQVADSGVIPVHGGFVQASKLAKAIGKSNTDAGGDPREEARHAPAAEFGGS